MIPTSQYNFFGPNPQLWNRYARRMQPNLTLATSLNFENVLQIPNDSIQNGLHQTIPSALQTTSERLPAALNHPQIAQTNNVQSIATSISSKSDRPLDKPKSNKGKLKNKPIKPEYAEPVLNSELVFEKNLFRIIFRYITHLKRHPAYKNIKSIFKQKLLQLDTLRDIKIKLCQNPFFTKNTSLSDLEIVSVVENILADIEMVIRSFYSMEYEIIWEQFSSYFEQSKSQLKDQIQKLRTPKQFIHQSTFAASVQHSHQDFRGLIPLSIDYDKIVERQPENGTFTLKDEKTGQVILQVLYFDEKKPQVTPFSNPPIDPFLWELFGWQFPGLEPLQPSQEPSEEEPFSAEVLEELFKFGEAIDSTYSKTHRGAATGHYTAATYTFGYSRRYDGDRDYRDPVFPTKHKSARKKTAKPKPVVAKPKKIPLPKVPIRKPQLQLRPVVDFQSIPQLPSPFHPLHNSSISTPVWASVRPQHIASSRPKPRTPLQLISQQPTKQTKKYIADNPENPFHEIEEDWKQLSRAGDLMWKQISRKSPDLAKKMLNLPYTAELEKRKLFVKNTAFTGITYNVSFATNYHHDRNDNPDFWAACLCLWENGKYPSNTDEGMIVLPEYGIGIQVGHGDLYLVQSRNVMHGVVPTHPSHKRISVIGWQHNFLIGLGPTKRREEEAVDEVASLLMGFSEPCNDDEEADSLDVEDCEPVDPLQSVDDFIPPPLPEEPRQDPYLLLVETARSTHAPYQPPKRTQTSVARKVLPKLPLIKRRKKRQDPNFQPKPVSQQVVQRKREFQGIFPIELTFTKRARKPKAMQPHVPWSKRRKTSPSWELSTDWEQPMQTEDIAEENSSMEKVLSRYDETFYEKDSALDHLMQALEKVKDPLRPSYNIWIKPSNRKPEDYKSLFADLGLVSDPNSTSHHHVWAVKNHAAWLRDLKTALQNLKSK